MATNQFKNCNATKKKSRHFKPKRSSANIDGDGQPDDSKTLSGRWTEREHYLFLLAVRQFGRDWKKIEQYVKTRSSTQARSHAQKVLKSATEADLQAEVDAEIERLQLLVGSADVEWDLSSPPTAPVVKSKRLGPKHKRSSKRAQSDDSQAIGGNATQSMAGGQSGAADSDDGDAEGVLASSESVYPDNVKVFVIEKVAQRRPHKRQKCTHFPDAADVCADVADGPASKALADSGMVHAFESRQPDPNGVGSAPEQPCQPVHCDDDDEPKRNDDAQLGPSDQAGCPQTDSAKQTRLPLKRGASFQDVETWAQDRAARCPQSLKLAPKQFFWFEQPRRSQDDSKHVGVDAKLADFDPFGDFLGCEGDEVRLGRKMTRDYSKLDANLFDELEIFGDKKLPLFNKY